VDDTVVNDQTYYYRVSAVSAAGEGPLTDSEHATPTAESGIDGEDGGNDIMLYVIIAVIVLAAAAVIVVLVLRRKRP